MLVTNSKANPPDSFKRGIFKVGREWHYKVKFIKDDSVKDFGTVDLTIPNSPPVNNQFPTLWKIHLKSNGDTVFHPDYMIIERKEYNEAKFNQDSNGKVSESKKNEIKNKELKRVWDSIARKGIDSFNKKEKLFKYMEKGVQENIGAPVTGSRHKKMAPNYYMVKPPRTGKLAFTQVSPFLTAPLYQLKHLKEKKLIKFSSMYVTNPPIYKGMVSSNHYFLKQEDVNTPYKKFENVYRIEAVSNSDLGEFQLTYHVHPKFGFVKMVYEKPDGTLVKLVLKETKGFE